MKKKLWSLLLLAALLLSLFPLSALAEEPAEGETEEPAADAETEETAESREGLGNIWGVPADDIIYFGKYNDKPVAWLVLDADQTNMGTEGVFLFSRDLMDSGKVAFDEYSTLWEGSLAQEWCANFADTAFAPAESALIPATDKFEAGTYPNHVYGLTWQEMELKGEKVFFLSVLELEQYYGSYASENKHTVKRCSLESYYWLRTPHYYEADYHSIVLQDNYVHYYLPYTAWAARPCINLNLQDAVYLLPAEDKGAPGRVEWPEAQGVREWKLLAPLEEHAFQAETVGADKAKLRVRYSGADQGDKAMLSLLIRDGEGKALSLWRIEKPKAAEGTLELDLTKLELPEGAVLYLFCEELNGPQETNYASPLRELKTDLPMPETQTAAPGGDGEASGEGKNGLPIKPRPAGSADGQGSAPARTPAPAAPAETPAPAADGQGAEDEDKPAIVALREGPFMEYVPATVLAFLLILAIVLFITAFRRRSVAPVVLLVLLVLLTLLVYLRAFGGYLPSRLIPDLSGLF